MISVILPTCNRRAGLVRCLESLERQSLPPSEFEVIVVDDGSADGTGDALAGLATRLKLTAVRQERRGPGAARNRGAGLAAGEILAFIEDDVVAEPGWLEAGSRALRESGAAAAEGLTRVEGEELRVFDSPEQLSFLPCNLFVRTGAFTSAGGYDEGFFEPRHGLYFREDADLGFRLLRQGCAIVKAGDAVVTHPRQFAARWSPWSHVRRYYFDPLLSRKHPDLYRERIEIKRVGGIRVPRPFHHAALVSLAGWAAVAAGWLGAGAAAWWAGGAAVLLGAWVMQFRYTHRWVPRPADLPRSVAFVSLPFYYTYWHVRGCLKFRHWKSLL